MHIIGFGWFGELLPAALGMLGASLVALWFRRNRGVPVVTALLILAGVSLLAARLAFVLQHFEGYGQSPASVFDVRDGGFAATAGLFAAFVTGAELVRRVRARRRALVVSSIAGIAVWAAATIATLAFGPARIAIPAAELRTMNGVPVRLRVDGKPMVVNLWASWCPPCRREMPALQAAQRRNPDIDFVFVNVGESPQAIEGFLASQGLALSNVYSDPRGEFASRARAFAYPTTLFYDSRGLVFMRQVGGLAESTLAPRLAMLRAASPGSPGAQPR